MVKKRRSIPAGPVVKKPHRKRDLDKQIGSSLFDDFDKFEQFFLTHWKKFCFAGGAIVVLAAVWGIGSIIQHNANNKAVTALNSASSMEELVACGAHTFIRIGTCGGLQPFTPIGTYVAAERSIGFDGVLYFYAHSERVRDLKLEEALLRQLDWRIEGVRPYAVAADASLIEQICGDDILRGVTIAANGFYGPQGRELRLPLADPELNRKIEAFEHAGRRITNFEMESSALAGLAALMGHRAMTVCCVIAGRVDQRMNTAYKGSMEGLIQTVLDRI